MQSNYAHKSRPCWFRNCLIVFALLVLTAGIAQAHKVSDSYLRLAIAGPQITGSWDIAVHDLGSAIGIDGDGDDTNTAGEIARAAPRIARYALSRLALDTASGPCPARMLDQGVDRRADGAFVVLRFEAVCPSAAAAVSVRYSLLFDTDRSHRGIARIERNGTVETAIFSSGNRVHLSGPGLLSRALAFVREGVWHIWIGLDHVLFVLTLLLPAMYIRRDDTWQARPSARAALGPLVKILTAFTLAHSITLGLAATGLLVPPARLVEAAIAATVVLAALNNMRPVVTGHRWAFAFGFGLIHGFGFAVVLRALGLPGDAMATTLFAFNIGVEIGQLAIVLAVLPLLYLLRRWPDYPRVAMPAGSGGIAAIGALWFVERAFAI